MDSSPDFPTIAKAPYPDVNTAFRDFDAEKDMDVIQSIVTSVRNIRSEHQIHPAAEIPLILRTLNPRIANLLRTDGSVIRSLAKTREDPVVEESGSYARPMGSILDPLKDGVILVIPMFGLMDGEREADRIAHEMDKLKKDLQYLHAKVSRPSFAARAPAPVVEETKTMIDQLNYRMAVLGKNFDIVDELRLMSLFKS